MTTVRAIVLVFIAMASNSLAGTPSSDVSQTRRLLCGGLLEIACDYATPVINSVVNTGKKQLTAVQTTLPAAVQQTITGHPESAVATLSDAEITQTQSLLGTIASAVPGYDKLDPHCNGFTCNAGSSPGTSGTCDSQFIAQSKTAYCGALTAAQCNVIKGSKIDYKKEIGFAADVVGASLAGGPAGGLAAALTLLQAELKTQYEAFVSNAGPVGTEVINSALNNLGTIFDSVTQCGLQISLKADIQTSSGQQCALCLCSPTANAFTPYLGWKINGGCTSESTTTGTVLNSIPTLTPVSVPTFMPVGYGR